jgi:hypothetical protein
MASGQARDESSGSGSIITPRLTIGLGSLILLLFFVLQNSAQAEIGFFWFGGGGLGPRPDRVRPGVAGGLGVPRSLQEAVKA